MIKAHVVFEGVDRCGKSSLVEKYCVEERPKQYFKMRVPKTFMESCEFYEDHIERLRHSEEPSVWDRGMLSELVYGPLYRPIECPAFHRRALIEMTRFPTLLPVIIVYVYPLWTDLMLPDERPGANIYAELRQFGIAYEALHWRKVAMTKHCIRNGERTWKNRDESWEELRRLIHIGLGDVT